MKIEKRGGRFHQERLGEFSVFSTAELITVITFLKRKVSSHLWMNAVIGAILNQQITITLSLEGNSHD
ncbi:hypothetical protein [Bacillus sp. 103mf]|uniref:hypothetical protein n=1 Tax=unclassified Bacillus (in: firmicutes) TaxID=185979 RepID=UPI0008F3F04C|nr:hypothetical protein SAMN04488574_102172 [Bacillus sp. 71mf]SFS40257.1 hypothetical protein SAMN04488145_101294 [Bacillus sp. 103mf]